MAAAAAVQQPVSAQVVGNAFVQQYYHIQHQSPSLVHRFYQDISKVGRPDDDGSMSFTTTLPAINEVILALNYGEYRAEIKSVDSQESYNGGVHVLVTGYMAGKDNIVRNFTQTFFLAPQEKGFFVLNDIFRYIDIKQQLDNPAPATDVDVAPVTPEQVVDPTPVPETHVPEQSVVPAVSNGEVEDQIPSDNEEEEEVPVAEVVDAVPEDPVPVAEVVNEVPDDSQLVSESNARIEEVPKKSYASIVMVMKENPLPVSSPPPPRRVAAKSQEQVKVAPVSSAAAADAHDPDALDNGNNQEDEADGFSIYIKGLPLNATPSLLENEFKKYGPIKTDGIQVRSNKQGFCFGFVEFEELPAVQKSMEASPISLGGRQVFIEEKRSTNSRVNSRGRFPSGRGSGFRSEGGRGGRGNFGNGGGGGGGRGYPRGGEFGGRSDFGNRGGNRTGGYSNRGGSDGYQRGPDSNGNSGGGGGRTNRGGSVAVNGAARNVAPRVSATA